MTPARIFTDPAARKLAKAVVRDDAAQVRHLIESGVDPNAIGKDGSNLLLLALDNDSKAAFSALLESGIDTDHRDRDGRAVLHHSVLMEDSWYTETILRFPVDPNPVEPQARLTPLLAAESNHPQMRALVAAGADLGLADDIGDTILHRSARLRDLVAVLDLLVAGADPMLTNRQGKTFQNLLRFDQTNGPGEADYSRRIIAWLRDHDLPLDLGPRQASGKPKGRPLAIGHIRRNGAWEPVFLVDPKYFATPMEFGVAVESVLNELDEWGIPARIDQGEVAFADPVFLLPHWDEFRGQLAEPAQ